MNTDDPPCISITSGEEEHPARPSGDRTAQGLLPTCLQLGTAGSMAGTGEAASCRFTPAAPQGTRMRNSPTRLPVIGMTGFPGRRPPGATPLPTSAEALQRLGLSPV